MEDFWLLLYLKIQQIYKNVGFVFRLIRKRKKTEINNISHFPKSSVIGFNVYSDMCTLWRPNGYVFLFQRVLRPNDLTIVLHCICLSAAGPTYEQHLSFSCDYHGHAADAKRQQASRTVLAETEMNRGLFWMFLAD